MSSHAASSSNRRSRRLCQMHASSPPPPSKRRKLHRGAYVASDAEDLNIAIPTTPQEVLITDTPKPQDDKTQEPFQTSSTTHSTFPFMNLPAELRLHVYRMALVRSEPLLLHLAQKSPPDSDDEAPTARAQTRARFKASFTSTADVPPLSRPPYDINVALLRTSALVYKEARQVLYSENRFELNIESGTYTLSTLHQRNRSLIKTVSLAIPSHHDILDCFADVVRLGLRYCWGLKRFTITLPNSFQGDEAGIAPGTTNVYANAFHILRWLPKGCGIGIEGNVSESIRRVVADEGRLLYALNEKDYLKRQHQMPERR